jgi:hypothetical protein
LIKQKTYLLLAILLFCNLLFSQTNTKHFTQENSVISNTVYASLSDSRGYMWFSTDQGVTRYDGFEFVNYTIDEGLTDNEVFKLFEDSKKRIWFLTYNGKPCYFQNDSIHNPENTPFLKNFTNKIFFTQVVEDEKGKIWFFKEYSREYYILDMEQVTKYELPSKSFYLAAFKLNNKNYFVYNTKVDNNLWQYVVLDFQCTSKIFSSFLDKNQYSNFYVFNNQVYFGIKGANLSDNVKIYKTSNLYFSKKDEVFIDTTYSFDKVYNIIEINKELFFTTNSGVSILNSQSILSQRVFENLIITSVSQDYEKGLWFTSKNNGIYYIPNLETPFYNNIREPTYIIKQNPYDYEEIYFSGLNTFSRTKGNTTQKFSLPKKYGDGEATTDIAFLGVSKILIGNGYGLCYYDGRKFEILQGRSGIKQILVDGDSIIYARSTDIIKQHINQLFEPLNIFNQPYRSIYSARTLSLLKSNDQKLIIGDNWGGHYLSVNGETKPVDSIGHRIKKIIHSENDYTVFCSDISGIYIKKDKQVTCYTTSNGLISNRVNSATFDKNSNLWVATSKGLSFIDIKNNIIKNFGSLNGIIDEKINDLLVINDTNLLLATASGVYIYNPLTNIDVSIPRMEILYIKVDAVTHSPFKSQTFNHDENNIEIHLSGISFNNNNLDFYYQIENKSEEWIKFNGRLLTFVNLPPGQYNINIKCKNSYHEWSETKQLQITIKPPFYMTWWFIVLSFSLMIIISSSIFYTYQKRKNKEKEIQLILSETKQKALRAQLNPHFVFNVLNSIQYLYISNKEDLALEYLNKFSVLLRNTLNHSDKLFITINEELENLKLYLEIEKIRTESQFDYSFQIGNEVDAFSYLIPSMLIQPFVENSVWHGFKGLTKKGEITIIISKKNLDYISIEISDNGNGFNKDKTTENGLKENESKGMKLIDERIKALNIINDKKISLSINSNSKGTQVVLIFPIKY